MLIADFEKRHKCKDPDDVTTKAWRRSRIKASQEAKTQTVAYICRKHYSRGRPADRRGPR